MTFTVTRVPTGTRVRCDRCGEAETFRLGLLVQRFKNFHVAFHNPQGQQR